MSQFIDPLNTKCSKCKIKPCAIICQECLPERGDTSARFCNSCYNLYHDERNIFHKRQSISFSNIKSSPRRTSLNNDDLPRGSGFSRPKYNSSSKTSPYKKDLFQSNVVSTPLNQHNAMSNYAYIQQSGINDSIEKKIKESRKKEVIMKLNELNTKIAPNPMSQSIFQYRYKDYLSNIKSPASSSIMPIREYVDNSYAGGMTYNKVMESMNQEKFEKIEKLHKGENNFFPKTNQIKAFNQPIEKNPLVSSIEEQPKNNETIKKLEEQKKKTQNQIEEIKKAIIEEDKKFEENVDSLKNQIIDEEGKRFSLLNEEVKKNTEDYDAQVRSLAFNLRNIKEEYESKIQDFEKLLKNSTGTIEKLQESIIAAKKKEKEQPKKQGNQKNDEETIADMKKELSKKKEILEKFKQGVKLSNDKCQEVTHTLDKIINSKEKIVQELVNDNNNKDDDIKKLHEIVENFKQMFEELNVQKESIVRDNERLALELEKAREIILEALEKAKENGEIDGAGKDEDNLEN